MNLEFSEEQQLLKNMVERFTSDHYDAHKRADYLSSDTGFSSKNWSIMADTGLLTLPFSERYGGLNGNAEDIIFVMQPLGKAVAVEPMLSVIVLAGNFLERIGSESQKSTWIPKIISGKSHIALAHIEANARFDLGYVRTQYKKTNEGVVLNGQKTFVLGAGAADAFIISAIATDDSADDKDAIAFFLVERSSPNLICRQYRLMDGSIACELDLQNTKATPMDGNFQDLQAAVSLTKIAACAEMVGLMELLLDTTLEYVKTREQFGRPLSKFQVIQHRLAESYANLELCRSHLMRIAAIDTSDENYNESISGSKAFISRNAVALAEEAIQLHGGIGVTDELIVGHAMKRVLLLSTLFGDVDTELRLYS